jgi:nucleotide-binding universal stress UspA family protein
MYDDILIPYDGSEGAAEILHHASEIAHWADATVQVLYVADTTRDSVTVVEGQTVDVLEREGEDVVEEAGKTLETLGTPYETDVVQGNPAPTIVDYAERYDQDLIVMPTHGREGVSRYLIGSVSEKVVRLSSVPVLTARMEPDEQLVFPYEDVLIPIDGSAPATHAAQHGLSLAASMDATVHALSVVEEGLIDVDVGADGEDSGTDAAEEAVDDLVAEAEEDGVAETVRHVERGTPNEVIVDLVESNEIDAVVMGTTGRRGTDRILLGSVAEKTVRSAPVPVITARQPE